MNKQECRTCGKEIPAGRKKYCDNHPNERVQKQQQKELKHIEQGVCKSCTKPISENSTVFCDDHLIANRERGVKDREKRRDAGMCRSCSEPLSIKSKTWCEAHRLQQNELSLTLSRTKREKEPCEDCGKTPRMTRKRRCESCQGIYEASKSETCRRVGCAKPTEVKHFCREHADEENEKLRQRRENLRKTNRCIFCFKPKNSFDESKYVLCFDCRANQRLQRTATA
ncbi:hypothetical protein BH09PAT1_BH09PAT1_6320 [soil metagenome]